MTRYQRNSAAFLSRLAGRRRGAAAFALPDEAKDAIRRLVHDLALGRWMAIEQDGRGGRLTAGELARAVSEYGETLIDLPDEAWALTDVDGGNESAFAVDVPMWTREEGRSDLTLSLSVGMSQGVAHVSIDDLHVL